MKIKLPIGSSDELLLNAVETWIDLLSKEKYQEALDFTEQDSYYNWTPELIKKWISNYGSHDPFTDGSIYKVTPINQVNAPTGSYSREVSYFDEPFIKENFDGKVIADIWYSLPLNNEWSDLIATFFVLEKEDYLTLLLQDIHVF